MRSVSVKANGNIYTATVNEDGKCVLDTGEELYLSTEQLETLAEMGERADRIRILGEKGREILPITDQERMEIPEEDRFQLEEATVEPEKKEQKISGKLDKEALSITDLDAYERNLEAVRRKREKGAKVLSMILAILLILSAAFLWLLNSGTLDPLLRQPTETAVEEVVNNNGLSD